MSGVQQIYIFSQSSTMPKFTKTDSFHMLLVYIINLKTDHSIQRMTDVKTKILSLTLNDEFLHPWDILTD